MTVYGGNGKDELAIALTIPNHLSEHFYEMRLEVESVKAKQRR